MKEQPKVDTLVVLDPGALDQLGDQFEETQEETQEGSTGRNTRTGSRNEDLWDRKQYESNCTSGLRKDTRACRTWMDMR